MSTSCSITLIATHLDIVETSCTGEVTLDFDGEGQSTATTGSSTPCSSVSSGKSSHTAEDNASSHVINEIQEWERKKRSVNGQARSKSRMTATIDIFSKTVKELKDADTKLLVELEEKRMKYEDWRLRKQDYEDRIRREDRKQEER